MNNTNIIIIWVIIWILSVIFNYWWFDRAYNHPYGRWNNFSKEMRKHFKKSDFVFIYIPAFNLMVSLFLLWIAGLPYSKSHNKTEEK